jgi:hypothetical protein
VSARSHSRTRSKEKKAKARLSARAEARRAANPRYQTTKRQSNWSVI